MWSDFYVSSLVLAVLLVIPGLIVLLAQGRRLALSLCCAAPLSVGMMCALGQLYAMAGITSTPLAIMLPITLIPLLALAVQWRRGALGHTKATTSPELPLWVPMLFVIVGIVVGRNLFVSRLPLADSIFQGYDITQHLNAIQAFSDSGRFTSTGVGYYLSTADQAIDPVGYTSFYPSAWHIVCALTMMVTGASAPVVINASMFLFSSILFPLGVTAFLTRTFEGNRRLTVLGAFVACAFVSFPWCLLVFGPLYPNLAGFALVPATLSLFMSTLDGGLSKSSRAGLSASLIIACLGLALLHPNTVFTCAVLTIPYCTYRLWNLLENHGVRPTKRALASSGFIALCVAFWVTCYKLPLMSDIVNHIWPPYASHVQELVNILTQTYTMYFFYEIAAQVFLGVLVIFGFVAAAFNSKRRWMAVSYLLTASICFVCATRDDALSHLLGGFWYTDAVRLAVVAVLGAIPLATLGLDWGISLCVRLATAHNIRLKRPTHTKLITAAFIACFLVINFLPSFDWPGGHFTMDQKQREQMLAAGTDDQNRSFHTTFGDYRAVINSVYLAKTPLDDEEIAFLKEAKTIVPSDALILNNPMDGSFLAYGVNGLRVYYRDFTKFHEGGNDDAQSKLIRERLSNISSDPDVKSAVDSIGAQYVLVLNEAASKDSFINLRRDFEPAEFSGISSITDQTPGFRLVARQGACSLYEIVA